MNLFMGLKVFLPAILLMIYLVPLDQVHAQEVEWQKEFKAFQKKNNAEFESSLL